MIFHIFTPQPPEYSVPDLSAGVYLGHHSPTPNGCSSVTVVYRPLTLTFHVGTPQGALALSLRGLLDSSLFCSHVTCLDMSSNWPCAGSRDAPALTESDSHVSCTTPCA